MKENDKAYQNLIDQMVSLAKSQGVAAWIKENKWPLDPQLSSHESNARFHNCVSQLTPEQRAVVAEMMHESRVEGIHDALFSLENYKIVSPDGVELPFRPYDQQKIDDWYCRIDGDEWPEDDETDG